MTNVTKAVDSKAVTSMALEAAFGMTPKRAVTGEGEEDSTVLNFKITVSKAFGKRWRNVMALYEGHYAGRGTAVVLHLLEANIDAIEARGQALPKIAKKSKKKAGAL